MQIVTCLEYQALPGPRFGRGLSNSILFLVVVLYTSQVLCMLVGVDCLRQRGLCCVGSDLIHKRAKSLVPNSLYTTRPRFFDTSIHPLIASHASLTRNCILSGLNCLFQEAFFSLLRRVLESLVASLSPHRCDDTFVLPLGFPAVNTQPDLSGSSYDTSLNKILPYRLIHHGSMGSIL